MAEFVETKKKSSGCGKYFFLVFLFILILGGGFFWWKYYYNFSEGNRSGLLQKFSHKGNVIKTYEGELLLSSVTSSNGVGLASEKFYFSVANDSVARQLMNMEGRWVKLHYTQKNGALPWVGETPYIVDGFTEEQSPMAPQTPGYYPQPSQQYQQPPPPQQYQQQQPQQYQQPQQAQPQQYQQQQPQSQYPQQNTPVQPQPAPQQQPAQQQPMQQQPGY